MNFAKRVQSKKRRGAGGFHSIESTSFLPHFPNKTTSVAVDALNNSNLIT